MSNDNERIERKYVVLLVVTVVIGLILLMISTAATDLCALPMISGHNAGFPVYESGVPFMTATPDVAP